MSCYKEIYDSSVVKDILCDITYIFKRHMFMPVAREIFITIRVICAATRKLFPVLGYSGKIGFLGFIETLCS